MIDAPKDIDLLVIGGGINGAGIACDAAGRGLKVALCEQGDLASQTSSASSKLIHGGLRYLEHYEFRLVRESLAERSTLLNKAPHLVHPMRFVLPHHPTMRPAWMLSLGLFLYDRLAKFDPRLPRSHRLNLRTDFEGQALNESVDAGFVYSDCWVDDARLVVANAKNAQAHGAYIYTRTKAIKAVRENGQWVVTLKNLLTDRVVVVHAKALVNAAGPWTLDVLKTCDVNAKGKQLRLVKGSHMVVDRLYEGDQAYIVQNDDGRIVFVIPYQNDFTLIGTTEIMMNAPPQLQGDRLDISEQETQYLCETVNSYFKKSILPKDKVWSFAGVRPLFDDASSNASQVTREYVLDLDVQNGPPLLSVFGGKMTTYRQLAEKALHQLKPFFPNMDKPWTAKAVLPGGDVEDNFAQHLKHVYPNLDEKTLSGMAKRHGELAHAILDGAEIMKDLGQNFGHGLCAQEVVYMMDHEWAVEPDDILWRRSKLGLKFDAPQKEELTTFMKNRIESSV